MSMVVMPMGVMSMVAVVVAAAAAAAAVVVVVVVVSKFNADLLRIFLKFCGIVHSVNNIEMQRIFQKYPIFLFSCVFTFCFAFHNKKGLVMCDAIYTVLINIWFHNIYINLCL